MRECERVSVSISQAVIPTLRVQKISESEAT
jgi:hypothetical protein